MEEQIRWCPEIEVCQEGFGRDICESFSHLDLLVCDNVVTAYFMLE